MTTHSHVALGVKRALGLAVLATSISLPLAHADTNYGPVRPGETLSDIVNGHYLVSPLSDQAIMQAIVRNNPGAFINGDIGRLRQGVILSLPADPAISQLQNGGIDLDAVSRLVSSQSSRPAPRAVVSAPVTPSPSNTSELSSLRQDLSQLRRERDSLKDELSTLEQNTDELRSKLQALETENRQVNRQLLSAESSLNTVREQLKQAEADKAEALESATAAQAKVEASEEAATSAQQAGINTDISSSEPANDNRDITSESESAAAPDPEILAKEGRRVAELEHTIREIQTQKERELADLRDAIAEKSTIQEAMEGNLNDLDETVRRYEAEIFELKTTITTLNDRIDATALTGEAPAASTQVVQENSSTEIITEASQALTQTTAFDPFSVRSVDDLKQSVNVPLWGLLLGALALALTSLMTLLGRRKRHDEVIASPKITPIIENEPAAELVFRTGASQLQDPDVESLRVPPRRDASRVAVLDPSIISSTETANEPEATESEYTAEQLQEGQLKLAMAEAYLELDDESAAAELLQEVRQEGSTEQIATANKLLSRLA
ncbi:FimV/HubP family polar landmark protein [Leucothrix mucor]|uniref:FimV/HubP family polar landmark protein n=1 Tax=Leucothrix mucor TaxID=45248 RepID=UPI0003B40F3C|nr:FimV/HubP family polar landmark protein [Leucothrix mucor]